jgi:hypothetical protein
MPSPLVQFRLAAADLERLEAAARRRGMTRPDFLREAVLRALEADAAPGASKGRRPGAGDPYDNLRRRVAEG